MSIHREDQIEVDRPEGPGFQAIGRPKVYASVVDQILESIRAGRLTPGSALPSERELAAQFQVSRGSLREAIRVLEHAGVVEVRVGSGTFVTQDSSSSVATLRAKAAVIGEHSPLDLVVARAAIEPVCAEQAALSHRPSDLKAIQQTVDHQIALMEAGDDITVADTAFHMAVAAATHNGVLLALQHTLSELMRENMWNELRHRLRKRSHSAEEYVEHHRLVLRAIEQRDARKAFQVMSTHMMSIELGLIAELEELEERRAAGNDGRRDAAGDKD